MTRTDLKRFLTDTNVLAFLRVIRAGESSQEDIAYRMMFGGGLFDSFADHPRSKNTAAGLTSTAAGAYQFLERTWDGLVKQYGFEDFSPQSQDEGCVALILGRKALDDVVGGRFTEAVLKCAKEWASLPGSPYGQPTLSWDMAKKVFEEWGGQYQPAVMTQEPAPVEERSVKGEPMAPFIPVAINALLGMAPDLIRLFGKGENVDRNATAAEKVVEVAKEVTNAVNAQEAVEKLQTNPELQERFRSAVAANVDQWLGMATRLAELDEASRQKAREFSTSNRTPVFFRFSFIELLSLIFVAISGAGGAYVLYGDFPPELKGSVITLMLIGGYTAVQQFWLGSSLGSLVKNPPK